MFHQTNHFEETTMSSSIAPQLAYTLAADFVLRSQLAAIDGTASASVPPRFLPDAPPWEDCTFQTSGLEDH
jgi:hypothetical protein